MFMIMKRNRTIKTRGVANGKHQKLHSDSYLSSPTPDLYAVKHACRLAAKEDRDTATVDLPGFFLQTEADGDKEPIIIALTGEVALLLVK